MDYKIFVQSPKDIINYNLFESHCVAWLGKKLNPRLTLMDLLIETGSLCCLCRYAFQLIHKNVLTIVSNVCSSLHKSSSCAYLTIANPYIN